jgi:hypothetical protein
VIKEISSIPITIDYIKTCSEEEFVSYKIAQITELNEKITITATGKIIKV